MAGVLLLLLLQSALCLQSFSTSTVKHLEPIEGFRIDHLGTHLQSIEPSSQTNDRGHIQPYPDELHVKFEAFGQVFRYNVSVDKDLFASDAKLRVQDGDRVVSEEPLRLTSYRATTENGWVAVTITPELLMHAVIALEDDFLQVDPIHSHKNDLESSHYSLLEKRAAKSKMVIFRHSELKTDDFLCGAVNSLHSALPNQSAPSDVHVGVQTPSRNLLQLIPFTNCFPNQNANRVLFVSFGLDYGFQRNTLANGAPSASAASSYIAQVVTSLNSVYFSQMNIFLKVQQVLAQAQSSTTTWNYDRVGKKNCPDISTALNTFSSWKQSVSTQTSYQTGIWHFGTDCYPPPGTVGLAWIGGLCRKYYGAGVSSYSSSFWLTVAHEIGHNFGASHSFQLGVGTTGGIMDYGDGKYQGVYQFHPTYSKSDVCAHITKEMSSTTCGYQDCVPQNTCWGTLAPQCGNGVIEPGETCDDGTNNGKSTSCCTTTCVPKAGAECSSGECCINCMFATTATSCSAGTGYCSAGTCKQTTCTRYGFPYSPCSTQPGNPCMYQCQYNGACSSMSGWYDSTTKVPFDMAAADGSICSRSPLSKCQKGKCVAGTSSATYSWQSSSWSACSVTCGSGTQTRSVWCMDSSGAKVANSYCSGTTPSSSQTCSNTACTQYVWGSSTSWSACSANCGGGTQTRPLPKCYATNNPSVAVASSLCGTPPPTIQSCNTSPCSLQWLVLSWSTCTKSCGGGTQTPKLVCVKTVNNIQYAVADSNCANLSKPGSRACNTGACRAGFVSAYGAWSACSAECGGGNQTRAVECRNDLNQVVDDNNCEAVEVQQPCNTHPCPVYAWNTSDFGPCSLSCGSGIQLRNVTCVEQQQNIEVADYLCTTTAPSTSQMCNTNPCPNYQWVTSAWGSCSVTCGSGISTRTVKCQDVSTNVDAVGFCNDSMPETTQNCSAPACPVYIWSYSDYGECSVSCGGGTQTRTGTCIIQGTTKQVSDSLCGQIEATSQACNTPPCGTYVWVPSAWTDCSQVCNGGTQTRVLKCINSVTKVAAPSNTSCDQSNIPATTRVCNAKACPGYWWFGPWSQCSEECGGGTYTRNVECRDSGSQAVLSDSLCAGAAPSTVGPCNSNPCPEWNATAYGPCSAACGDGFATRNVTCYDSFNEIEVDASRCKGAAPASQTTCKNIPCPNWVPTAWGPCSAHCGGGTQTRQLICRFPQDYQNGIPADEALCPVIKPATTQTCMPEPCPTYYYSIENWGECSTTCGDGIQTGTVTCLNGSVPVPLSNCVGSPPNNSRTCNLRSCPTYSWVSASEWSSCDGVCITGTQTRQVTCIDTSTNTAVSSSLCGPLSIPSAQQCPADYSCKQGSQCKNDTNGNFCKCTLGYSGDDCSIRPEIRNVNVDIAQFPQGIPLGESTLVSWDSIGYMPFVAILLDKQSWKYPRYVSAEAINDIQTSLTTRTFTWKVDNSLPVGNDYQLIVYYSLDVYRTFPETGFFAIADPCAYISCGAYGTCKSATGTCDCLPGYGGDFCELTPCAKSRCSPITSNCSDSGASRGFCQCHPGWTGTTCDVPVGCSFSCLNGGFVNGAFSSPDPCKNLTCSCQNFFHGKYCEQCQLSCKHGAPDSDCLSCQCGANSGWMGRDCSCRYYILSVHVRNTQLRDNDNTDWVNDPSELASFKEGFAQDIATTLKISPKRVIPALVKPDGIFNNSVEVLFLLTEDCVDVAPSQISAFPIREAPVHFDLEAFRGESESIQYHLLEADTPVNGESASLDGLVKTLRRSLDDKDSAFSRGYVTSGVLVSQGLLLVQTSQDQPASESKSSWVDDNYWVIIVATGGLLLILASFIFWVKRRKPAPVVYEHETIATEPSSRDKKTKALFRGELAKKDSETEMTNTDLPEGWTKMFEERTGQYYYYNTKSGVSQWEVPTEPAY